MLLKYVTEEWCLLGCYAVWLLYVTICVLVPLDVVAVVTIKITIFLYVTSFGEAPVSHRNVLLSSS
jgi:hypothetical protein